MARAFLDVRDDLGVLQARLDIAVRGLDDFRTLWARIKRPWYASRYRMFLTRGAETGAAWPDYAQTGEAAVYVHVKRALLGEFYARRVLRWMPGRERLMPSLVSSRHAEAVWIERPETLEMGTRVPYAGDHDAGRGRAPRWAGGHAIPKRPLLRLGSRFVREVAEQMGEVAAEVDETIAGRRGAGLPSREVAI